MIYFLKRWRKIKAKNLKNDTLLNQLSKDAISRLNHCFPAIYNAIENIGRRSLSDLLRQLWKDLEAEKALTNESQINNLNNYFKLIENLEVKYKNAFARKNK